MDRLFERDGFTNSEDVTVYRGLGGGPRSTAFLERLQGGVTITDRGFTSTSTNKNLASFHYVGEGGALLAIKVPKGKGRFLPGGGLDKELILDRGSQFKVLGRKHVATNYQTNRPEHTVVELLYLGTSKKAKELSLENFDPNQPRDESGDRN